MTGRLATGATSGATDCTGTATDATVMELLLVVGADGTCNNTKVCKTPQIVVLAYNTGVLEVLLA